VATLRHGNTGDFVFVLKDDRTVEQRPVKAGQATVDKVQIVTGLKVGERVITEGADRLRDGSRVVLPGDAPADGVRGGADRARGAASGGRGAASGGRRRGAAPAASAPSGSAAAAPAATQ
jgi:membrane fusion protein, multidrug efflux system